MVLVMDHDVLVMHHGVGNAHKHLSLLVIMTTPNATICISTGVVHHHRQA